ncbi:unnamed protein product [Amoebophrya sp. A25]|nr:unnamed protein product [Amoebophrya sp. A25]|eukprot:GSA25T00015022001.1
MSPWIFDKGPNGTAWKYRKWQDEAVDLVSLASFLGTMEPALFVLAWNEGAGAAVLGRTTANAILDALRSSLAGDNFLVVTFTTLAHLYVLIFVLNVACSLDLFTDLTLRALVNLMVKRRNALDFEIDSRDHKFPLCDYPNKNTAVTVLKSERRQLGYNVDYLSGEKLPDSRSVFGGPEWVSNDRWTITW